MGHKYAWMLIVFFIVSCAGEDPQYLEEITQNPNVEEEELNNDGPAEEPEQGMDPGRLACVKGLSQGVLLVEAIRSGDFDPQESCRKANKSQIRQVERGNAKYDKFLKRCYDETENSCWCAQLTRPNPDSINKFYCTYPRRLPHRLINPDEKTWKHAIESVKIVKELEDKNIGVNIIYNWWRPEPYNKNIGGSPTRHPHGTAVDVYFASKVDQNKAHKEVCKMRRRGRVRAVGYYQSSALHLGVGDRRGNTWGKSCN